uniref:Uncharacterized protein n=1 Tax=Parascaris univalens TaxID=6257 RepID=A0A915C5C2_PARUN
MSTRHAVMRPPFFPAPSARLAEGSFSVAMEQCRRNVTVWMKSGRSHVEPLRSILWRVKNATRIGETIRGLPDGEGQLVEFEWDSVLGRFPPCIVEVCCANAPLSALLNAFSLLPQENLHSFFSHLQVLCISSTDVSFNDVISLLSLIPMLSAFSYSDSGLSGEDFETLITALLPLQLRGIDVCDGEVDIILKHLNLEMLRFSASPGIKFWVNVSLVWRLYFGIGTWWTPKSDSMNGAERLRKHSLIYTGI